MGKWGGGKTRTIESPPAFLKLSSPIRGGSCHHQEISDDKKGTEKESVNCAQTGNSSRAKSKKDTNQLRAKKQGILRKRSEIEAGHGRKEERKTWAKGSYSILKRKRKKKKQGGGQERNAVGDRRSSLL